MNLDPRQIEKQKALVLFICKMTCLCGQEAGQSIDRHCPQDAALPAQPPPPHVVYSSTLSSSQPQGSPHYARLPTQVKSGVRILNVAVGKTLKIPDLPLFCLHQLFSLHCVCLVFLHCDSLLFLGGFAELPVLISSTSFAILFL